MSHAKQLNPHLVHDAAAYLFWSLAEQEGVTGANEAVIESGGECLFASNFVGPVLAQFGFAELSNSDKNELADAIAGEALRFAVNGENMIGVIYSDDAQSGRSPSARTVDTTEVNVIPRKVTSSVPIEKIGHLCLRHPLPAVVFSKNKPRGSIIQIADTIAALGFNLPIFLTNFSSQQIGVNLYAINGVMHIPVPDIRHGNLWGGIIQNSTRFTSGITFYVGSKPLEVKMDW